MNVGVVGPGAIGCLFAAKLRKSGENVYLIDNKRRRAKKLQKQGIIIDDEKIHVPVIANPEVLPSLDLLLFCVKAYDTRKAVSDYKKLIINNQAYVLTLQNGIGNVKVIRRVTNKVYAGTTCEAATLLRDGIVKHHGTGETMICGEEPGWVVRVLNKAGFHAKESNNLEGVLWSKLVLNSGINALSAIYEVTNGELVSNPYYKEELGRVIDESWRVSRAKGIKLLYDNPVSKAYEVCEKTRNNHSSMLQDLLRGKRTEIDYINGKIIEAGRDVGVRTPLNERLYELVKRKEVMKRVVHR